MDVIAPNISSLTSNQLFLHIIVQRFKLLKALCFRFSKLSVMNLIIENSDGL